MMRHYFKELFSGLVAIHRNELAQNILHQPK